MKDHGILMSDIMVRAYLEGRKTQTRRTKGLDEVNENPSLWEFDCFHGNIAHFLHPNGIESISVRLPYGNVGGSLWFRETWAHDGSPHCTDHKCGNPDHLWYRASEDKVVADSFAGSARWRSSMFMPRWAARIVVPVKRVRVERLQNITYEDALAEGVSHNYPEAFAQYRELWDSLNAKRGMSWDTNPWVWVYEFPRYDGIV